MRLRAAFILRVDAVLSCLGRFFGPEGTRGAIMVIFALSLVPMTMTFGTAMDFAHAEKSKVMLRKAIDTAALGALAQSDPSEDQVMATANAFLEANLDGLAAEITSLNIHSEPGKVRIDASAEVPTTLMSAFGIDSLTIEAESEAIFGTMPVEIALVIDNTGSVYEGGVADDLKAAIKDFLTELETQFATGSPGANQPRVALIPYTSFVNVKGPGFKWDWIDTNGYSSIHRAGLDLATGETLFDLFDQIPNAEWMGCVMARPGDLEWEDTAPDIGDGDSLFVPLFSPDEPDHWIETGAYARRANNYLPDDYFTSSTVPNYLDLYDALTTEQVYNDIIRSTDKYNGTPFAYPSAAGTSINGPNNGCDSVPVMPLTTDVSSIRNAVDQLSYQVGGGTNTAEGMAWGYRVLSPDEPFSEGNEFSPATQKIMIVFTDGINNASKHEESKRKDTVKSTYTAYGYRREARLGFDSLSDYDNHIDDRMLDVCDKAKEYGILVHTNV
ncbi:MAG: pilus assembly protein [Pseudomonadota bacterium]